MALWNGFEIVISDYRKNRFFITFCQILRHREIEIEYQKQNLDSNAKAIRE